jgi:hypothetical protein
MTPLRSSAVLVAITLAVAGTAGCGDEAAPDSGARTAASDSASATPDTNGTDTLPTKQALNAATKAFLAAETVHLKGDVVDGGDKISIDLRQTRSGDAVGTIGLQGMRMTILTIGQNAYISGDKAFWTKSAGADAYRHFKGKYLKTKLSSADFEELALFSNRAEFAKQVLPTDAIGGKKKTVNGTAAFGFTDDQGGNFYVSLQGKPYPVRLDGTDEGTTVALDFLDYDKPVNLTPPPPSKIITT